MFNYQVFNTNIESEVPISFLEKKDSFDENKNKIKILHRTHLKNEYKLVTFLGMKYGGEVRAYDTDESTLVFYENNIKLSISKKDYSITIVSNEIDLDEAILYCFTSGIIISLYYQGLSILHASSFEYNKGVYAFLGDSGTGKSTLLFSMLNHNIKVNSDDLLIIDKNLNVFPNQDLPYRLWDDSLDVLNFLLFEKTKMLPELNKNWIRIESKRKNEVVYPLKTIFILKPYQSVKSTEIKIREMNIEDKLKHLVANLHAFWCIPKDIKHKQMQNIKNAIKDVKIIYIYYPKRKEFLNDLTDSIFKFINN